MTTRFGLFGTGPWATDLHGPALVDSPGVELVGVWGRDPAKASALAGRLGCTPYNDIDALLDDVDAVAVALPPDVQAPLAEWAAHVGKHLLLDKPLALTSAQARAVVDAVDDAGVASVVFFTGRYLPDVAQWMDTAARQEWSGAHASWLGSIFRTGSPFGASPWRQQRGGLWDVGPHCLAVVLPLMGPVREVSAAVLDPEGTAHLLLTHVSGAVSSLDLGLDVPEAAAGQSFTAYGASGRTTMPVGSWDAATAYAEAVRQLLAAAATSPPTHPLDVHFAADVVDVLEQAQALLDRRS